MLGSKALMHHWIDLATELSTLRLIQKAGWTAERN